MKYGALGKSIVKSVTIGYLTLISYIFLSQFIDGHIFNIQENALVIFTTTVVYLGFSLAGWILVGIPTHMALCHWLTPQYRYYLCVDVLLILVILTIYGFAAALVFGIAILLQSVLFRYFVFK